MEVIVQDRTRPSVCGDSRTGVALKPYYNRPNVKLKRTKKIVLYQNFNLNKYVTKYTSPK